MSAAAKEWRALGRPHRMAYALWRQAEALLRGQDRQAAVGVLREGADLAAEHAPLLTEIRALARRARIDLAAGDHPDLATPAVDTPYGLTERERQVLTLLAQGRTNAQIGAALYISPKTASVHVTKILRKLGVTNRVEAATLAERAGLADATRR